MILREQAAYMMKVGREKANQFSEEAKIDSIQKSILINYAKEWQDIVLQKIVKDRAQTGSYYTDFMRRMVNDDNRKNMVSSPVSGREEEKEMSKEDMIRLLGSEIKEYDINEAKEMLRGFNEARDKATAAARERGRGVRIDGTYKRKYNFIDININPDD